MKEKKIFDIEEVGFGDEIGFRIPPRRVSKTISQPVIKQEVERQVEPPPRYESKEVKKELPEKQRPIEQSLLKPSQPKSELVRQYNRNVSPKKTRFAAEEFISPITGSRPRKPQVVHVAYGEYQWKGAPLKENEISTKEHSRNVKNDDLIRTQQLKEECSKEPVQRSKKNDGEVKDELQETKVTIKELEIENNLIEQDVGITQEQNKEVKKDSMLTVFLPDEEIISESKLQNEESNVVVEDEILVNDAVLTEIFTEDGITLNSESENEETEINGIMITEILNELEISSENEEIQRLESIATVQIKEPSFLIENQFLEEDVFEEIEDSIENEEEAQLQFLNNEKESLNLKVEVENSIEEDIENLMNDLKVEEILSEELLELESEEETAIENLELTKVLDEEMLTESLETEVLAEVILKSAVEVEGILTEKVLETEIKEDLKLETKNSIKNEEKIEAIDMNSITLEEAMNFEAEYSKKENKDLVKNEEISENINIESDAHSFLEESVNEEENLYSMRPYEDMNFGIGKKKTETSTITKEEKEEYLEQEIDNSLEEAKNLLDNVFTKFFKESSEPLVDNFNETLNELNQEAIQEEIKKECQHQELNVFGETGTLHDVEGVLDILNNEGTVNSLIENLLIEDGLMLDGKYSDIEFVDLIEDEPIISLDLPSNPIVESGFTPKEQEPFFDKTPDTELKETFFYYETPSLDLLDDAEQIENQNEDWIIEKMEIVEQTFNNFGVGVRLTGDYTQGPTVTQIEIQPEAGTKMSKIIGLINDLKLNLSVEELRIEPVAGKNTIGIEVPNPIRRRVKLKDVLSRPEFVLHESPLCIGLGEDIAGNPVYTDILKMPHGLIAGQTGSGKSVCINTLLISILYKASPEDVRLMLIDPKRVELAPYNNIPHLVTPVISDEKKAADGLKWAVNEMERRYELFARNGVREIKSFNNRRHEFEMDYEKLPYIVIIIDELADLMMVSAQEVEDHIMRITQKARAAGIHLIVATQRPTVDVITGTIKSNIPSRIAFTVAQANDSRVILDENGAQNLLGYGDLLLSQSGMKLKRVQGSYISDEEIDRVVDKVKLQGRPQYLIEDQYFEKGNIDSRLDSDPYIRQSLEFFLERGHATASSLQTRMGIGYNRAARIVDILEQQGLISEPQGATRKRAVLVTHEEVGMMFDGARG